MVDDELTTKDDELKVVGNPAVVDASNSDRVRDDEEGSRVAYDSEVNEASGNAELVDV